MQLNYYLSNTLFPFFDELRGLRRIIFPEAVSNKSLDFFIVHNITHIKINLLGTYEEERALA